MVGLGLDTGMAGWKAETNPLSYGGTTKLSTLFLQESANPGLFFVYFRSFETNNTIFTTMWKNVHQISGAGIWTHDLSNMSRLPKPLDQGPRHLKTLNSCSWRTFWRCSRPRRGTRWHRRRSQRWQRLTGRCRRTRSSGCRYPKVEVRYSRTGR